MSLPTPLPYREPTEQEVKTFSDAKESEDMQDLIDELAEVLDCNYDKETLCELVFAGNGIIRLNFTDGTKNTVGYEFIELSRARNLTGILVEPLTLTPTPEPEPMEQEEESNSNGGNGGSESEEEEEQKEEEEATWPREW